MVKVQFYLNMSLNRQMWIQSYILETYPHSIVSQLSFDTIFGLSKDIILLWKFFEALVTAKSKQRLDFRHDS